MFFARLAGGAEILVSQGFEGHLHRQLGRLVERTNAGESRRTRARSCWVSATLGGVQNSLVLSLGEKFKSCCQTLHLDNHHGPEFFKATCQLGCLRFLHRGGGSVSGAFCMYVRPAQWKKPPSVCFH